MQLNLAGKDARSTFAATEKSSRHLEAKLRQIERESLNELHGVGHAAGELMTEIRSAYKRIRDLL